MGGSISEGDWSGTVTDIAEGIPELPAKAQELAEEVESWLDWLDDWVVQPVLDALAWIGEKVEEIVTKLGEAFANMGDPFTLWDYADSWTKIGEDVGHQGVAGYFTTDAMQTGTEWKGRAADAYDKMLPPQQKSLEGMSTATGTMNSVLDKMAWGIVGFWVAIGAMLVTLIIELIGVIAAACSGVGIPAAVGGGVASLAKAWGIITGVWFIFESFVGGTVTSSLTELENGFNNDNNGLVDGHWPSLSGSNVDLSDSSHKDGVGHDVKDKETEDWTTEQDPAK